MKKTAFIILLSAVCLSACQNRMHLNGIDSAVEEAFNNQYPNAWDVEWEQQAGNTIVMDFRDGLYEKEAWYLTDGTWIQTRTELPLYEVPKTVIEAALASLGAGWYIEEAEYYETSSTPAAYYLLDCEKMHAQQEARVKVLPDGTVLDAAGTGTPGTGTDTPGTGGDIFAAAKSTFATMYPGAQHVEWEMEYGKLSAEFYLDRHEKEAWFMTDGTWMFTETELAANEVPQNLVDIVMAKLGDGWHIDDADHFLSSTEPYEYYTLECENNFTDREAKLSITKDGIIL